MSQATTISADTGSVAVAGNVGGSINVSNRSVEVHTNYGTVINEADTPPVARRSVKPQPPHAPLDFFDRVNELAQIDQLIAADKPITVYGHDGAGKSTLLRQIANGRAAQALPDGVVLIEGIDEQGQALKLGDVIQRLFDALYQSTPPLKVNDAIARTYLSNTRPLVLLDNVQLAAPDQYRTLIDLFPHSSLLIALPGSLSGLTRLIRLGPLPRPDAIELLAAQLGLTVDASSRAWLDAICALLSDVPLAIVRTADVIREAGVPLDRARDTLATVQPSTADAITTGLERAYAFAYSVLSPEEREVLATAANLPGVSIDPAMLTAKAAIIDRLKALGLLHANSPRVRIDPGLRSFARANTNETPIKDRLIAQLLADVRAGKFADDQYCANELGHVLGAINWAADNARWTQVIALARAIDPYLTLHGLWDAWGESIHRVLTAARSIGNRKIEAWALHQLGTHAINVDANQAINFYRQALALRQALGDTIGAAYTQHNLNILIPPIPPQRAEPKPRAPSPKAGMPGLLKASIITLVVISVVAVGTLFSGSVLVGPDACYRFVPDVPIGRISENIARARNMHPGDPPFGFEFAEEELNSYVHEFAGANNILSDGRARLVAPGVVMICGDYPPAGNLPIAVKFRIVPGADQPFQLDGIATRVIDTGGGFGWVAVPNAVAEQYGLMDRIREVMGGGYVVTRLDSTSGSWFIEIRGR